MKALKPILVIGLVFVAGIVVGVFGTRAVFRRAVEQMAANPAMAEERMVQAREHMEKGLIQRLDLTPEQQAKVHEIFLESGKQLRELRGEFQPRVQEIMRNAHQQIAATLTPEQREKYQRLSRERWGRGPMMRPRE